MAINKNLHYFSNYEIIFFGHGVEAAPDRIILSKNNKEILGVCVSPKRKDDLRQLGVSFNKEDIELLKKWRFIEENNGLLHTKIVIEDTLRVV